MSEPIKDLEEFMEITYGTDPNWEVIQHDEEGGKHDCTEHVLYVKNKQDGKHYLMYYSCSYNHGVDPGRCMEFPMQLEEIKLIPVTTYKYELIK